MPRNESSPKSPVVITDGAEKSIHTLVPDDGSGLVSSRFDNCENLEKKLVFSLVRMRKYLQQSAFTIASKKRRPQSIGFSIVT
jgi:hypothetical protein